MNIVQKSRALGLSIGLIAAFGVLVPIGVFAQDLYVASSDGTIKKISPTGVVSDFPTSGLPLIRPSGLAFDSTGTLVVSDCSGGCTLKKISPTGVVSAFSALSGLPISLGFGLAFDSTDTLFASNSPDSVYSISSTGVVSSAYDTPSSISGLPPNNPYGIAFDSTGTLFVASATGNSGTIQKISPTRVVSDFTTSGLPLNIPLGIAFDSTGNLFEADSGSGKIQKISSTGVVSDFPFSGRRFGIYGIAFAPSSTSTAVPEPFTIVGTLIGGTAALRMRKKLKSSSKV